jgi:hypothetical protein
MRTTLEIEDDVLAEAKELARQRGVSLGQMLSELSRTALRSRAQPTVRNGVPLFTPTNPSARPDLALVNSLRDEE